jgi:D-hydroxyproline dehydrogenase subunit gamma
MQTKTETLRLRVDGLTIEVPAGCMVSAAVAIAGASKFRTSVTGQPRAALCGMGICFECRVTINGRAHCKSCQIPSEAGMEVETGA